MGGGEKPSNYQRFGDFNFAIANTRLEWKIENGKLKNFKVAHSSLLKSGEGAIAIPLPLGGVHD